jgi:hypothetical protein
MAVGAGRIRCRIIFCARSAAKFGIVSVWIHRKVETVHAILDNNHDQPIAPNRLPKASSSTTATETRLTSTESDKTPVIAQGKRVQR